MPLFTLSIVSDVAKLERRLSELDQKQIPFGASQAINRIARQIVNTDLPEKMKAVFDRPTPWVLKGFAWRKSTSRSLSAEIFAREFAGKGNPAWKTLDAEVFGGVRRQKRFERALQAVGGGRFAAPGRGAKLNSYGNVSAGDIEKILSALGAAEHGSGYIANRTARSTKRGRGKKQTFFIAHARDDGAPIAIYRVVGPGKVEPVLVFTKKAPAYHELLPYAETVQKSFTTHKDQYLSEEMAKAIATAK